MSCCYTMNSSDFASFRETARESHRRAIGIPRLRSPGRAGEEVRDFTHTPTGLVSRRVIKATCGCAARFAQSAIGLVPHDGVGFVRRVRWAPLVASQNCPALPILA